MGVMLPVVLLGALPLASTISRLESFVDAQRKMVAHVVADLRDLHSLIEHEQHTEGLNRPRYMDRLAIAIV